MWLRFLHPQSPYHPESFVKIEGFVRCNDWDVFHEGLCDDLPIEGIRMMCGQIEKLEGMFWRVRQDPQLQVSNACDHVSLGKRELPLVCFTAISVREATLISRTAVPFRSADIATRERRSGALTAHTPADANVCLMGTRHATL
jgi:hypothetical protein